MQDVNASSQDVKKLVSALQLYEREQKACSKKVQSAISRAQWNDKKKDQFAAKFNDQSRQLERFLSSGVQEMIKSLNELARRLEEIERMHM